MSVNILAAIDKHSSPQDIDAKLQALNHLHTKKVQSLMKSIDDLKTQVAAANAQSKEHRRSGMIQSLRSKLREQELVSDVLKAELSTRCEWSAQQTNDFVIAKTCGGPKRFRPKTREELQNELALLEKRYRRATQKLKEVTDTRSRSNGSGIPPRSGATATAATAAQGGSGGGGLELTELDTTAPPGGFTTGAGAAEAPSTEQSTRDLGYVGALMDEVEDLRVAVQSRDVNIHIQLEALDRLRAENGELRQEIDRLGSKQFRAKELKRKAADLSDKYLRAVDKFEAAQEEVVHLRAQLELQAEENRQQVADVQAELLRHAEAAAELLRREAALQDEADKAAVVAAAERCVKHHDLKGAEAAAGAASAALREKERQLRRAQEDNAKLNLDLQRLSAEVVMTASLRERVRALSRELADAQGRPVSAKSSAATALKS
ncbi:unnamed protein product [Phaeothamnion confervicola]